MQGCWLSSGSPHPDLMTCCGNHWVWSPESPCDGASSTIKIYVWAYGSPFISTLTCQKKTQLLWGWLIECIWIEGCVHTSCTSRNPKCGCSLCWTWKLLPGSAGQLQIFNYNSGKQKVEALKKNKGGIQISSDKFVWKRNSSIWMSCSEVKSECKAREGGWVCAWQEDGDSKEWSDSFMPCSAPKISLQAPSAASSEAGCSRVDPKVELRWEIPAVEN